VERMGPQHVLEYFASSICQLPGACARCQQPLQLDASAGGTMHKLRHASDGSMQDGV
jgi:hypothetical protein